jgi:CheY-like chemotaxis protein
MSGSLQLLEMECSEKTEAQELIAIALRSVSRGAELTGKLLAFARRQRLMPQATDPRALLQDIESMLKRTLGDTIKLEVRCENDLPAAFVDPTQLDAALVNLALNARDAMPRGGEITIEARHALIDSEQATPELPVGYYVVITVADTGRGMAPATLARAMEPFFTTKEAGRGSGLGLSMVYGFAKQSGGHLQITSSLGAGTQVELFLPAARHAAPQGQSSASASVGGKGEAILVVEDDTAVRNIAVAFLRSSGYRVEAVANAADALSVLRQDRGIDVLFSDVMLGDGLNGHALAQEARRERPDLPVLLTSGYEEHLQSAEDSFDLLRKPYRREQLLAAIRKELDAAPRRRAPQ